MHTSTSEKPPPPNPDHADTEVRIPITKVPALSTGQYDVIESERRTIQNSPSIQLLCSSDTAEVEHDILFGYATFLSWLTGNPDVAFAIRRWDFLDPRTSEPGLHYVVCKFAEKTQFEEGKPEQYQLRELRCNDYHPEVEFALELGSPTALTNGTQNYREVGLTTNVANILSSNQSS